MSTAQSNTKRQASTSHIYLDHNSTTPVLPEVADAVREALLQFPGNAGSQHELGRQSRRALEEARNRIGELLGARMTGMDADRVIITSGGTEAANLAVLGLWHAQQAAAPTGEGAGHLVTSAIEHPCILEAASQLPHCTVERLEANADGVVDAQQLSRTIQPNTRLVSVMLANNETGVLQPVAQMAAQCVERGILMHSDAAQVVGKLPVNFANLNLAALSLASHKFYGPLGIGVLLLRHGVALQPTLFGGHQQAGLRPGTESAALAIGMCTALEICQRDAAENAERITKLRDQFERALAQGIPDLVIIGSGADRLPNTSNVAFVGLNRQALLMALDQAGVACSSGSACASGSSEPSPVLVAMGLKKEVLDGSIRFSLGLTTTAAEIEESCRRILSVCKRLR